MLEGGGPIIFFCSPEHQQLVWHNHKRVGRDKSASFVMPPLSTDELERFTQFARRRVLLKEGSPVAMTVAEFFESEPRFGVGKGEINSRIFPSLTSADNLEQTTQQIWLARARGLTVSHYKDEFIENGPNVRLHTVWEIVTWITTTTVHLFPDAAQSKENFARLRHHALVFATILQLKAAASTDNFNSDWIRISFEHLTGAIDAAVCSQDAVELRELANTLTAPISQVGCGLKAPAVILATKDGLVTHASSNR